MSAGGEVGRGRWQAVVVAAAAVCGAALLVAGSLGEMWFDEILSFQWASGARGVWDLLALYRHDNNHPLNTAWMMLLGEGREPWAYRVPAVVFGTATILLTGWLAVRACGPAWWLPPWLAAISFPLALYGSEARGIAGAVAAALASAAILVWCGWRLRAGWVAAFWAAAVAGVFSHGLFLAVWGGILAWSALVMVSREGFGWRVVRDGVVWFGPPLALAVWHYFYFLRPMVVAGGPEVPLPVVFAEFFAYASGLPATGGWLVAAGVMGVCVAAMAVFGPPLRLPCGRWLAVAVVVVLPVVSVVAGRAQFVYFRYFLGVLPFVYLLAGAWVAALAGRFGRRSWVVAGVLGVLYLAGQGLRIADWLGAGRGGSAPALRMMAAEPGIPRGVVADHDLRTGIVVQYHRRNSPPLAVLDYRPSWEIKKDAGFVPGWVITHSQGGVPGSVPRVVRFRDRDYDLFRIFRAGPVSGFDWRIYKIKQP